MMKWLLSVLAILLIGASSSYTVNYDVADNLMDSFEDPSGSQEYETETEVPEMETEEPNVEEPTGGEDYYDDYFAVKAEEEAAAANYTSLDYGEEEEYPDATSESVADGFEDYVDNLEEEAEVADEFEDYIGDLDSEAENQGNATVVDSVPSFEEGDYGASESNTTDESVADGFEDYVDNLEEEAEVADEFEDYIGDLDSEAENQGNATVVDSVPSFEEGDYGAAESNATDESVADGFGEYVDNLEEEAEVADEFEDYIGDLDSEAENQGNATVVDSVPSFEEGDYGASESNATDESVADGFEDYVDNLEEEAEVADEFEDYIGDLDSEAENQGNATVVDSVPSFEEGDYGASESNATDESVADGFGEYVDNLEDEAEVADEFEDYIGDIDSEADSQPEPQVDDSDVIPFENSDGDRNGTAAPSTPNMQEEVGITEDNNISSTSATVVELMPEDAVSATDESVKAEDDLPIDDELVKELEELHDIPDEKELVDDYINYNEGTLDEFENSTNPDSSEVIADGLQTSVQETTQDKDTDIEAVDSTLYDTGNDTVAHSSLDVISDITEPDTDHDFYDSEQVAADQDSWDTEVVDPSYIPLDTDTQDEADGHGGVSYEDYDRESVYYPDEDSPVASDHSTGIQDSENDEGSYLDADDAEEYPSYEPPSEDGSGSFTDGPAYEHVDLVDEEIIEVEVDIPGHISQGDFYDTEYNNFIEESKFSFDDSLSSYHTITYFLFIVLLSVIVYVVYTNKHRFFKRQNNYAYSRLGEQRQPLV